MNQLEIQSGSDTYGTIRGRDVTIDFHEFRNGLSSPISDSETFLGVPVAPKLFVMMPHPVLDIDVKVALYRVVPRGSLSQGILFIGAQSDSADPVTDRFEFETMEELKHGFPHVQLATIGGESRELEFIVFFAVDHDSDDDSE